MVPENPMFRLVPHRFGKKNVVPSFEEQFGPIREVRFKYKPDGTRDGAVHQLWVVRGIKNDPTIAVCRQHQATRFRGRTGRGQFVLSHSDTDVWNEPDRRDPG
jgi:hypothetical protein